VRHPFPSLPRRLVARALILCLLAQCVAPAFANPLGGSVASGTATIDSSGSVLTVRQSTDRAILNWQSFSNAAGETVRFQQPSTTAATLNRVTGACSSVINGNIESNGQVFLINPNGVLIGKTANVQVGGLVASTLDTSDASFQAGTAMSGLGSFAKVAGKSAAAVVNQGTISTTPGGRVALLGGFVSNEGKISAPGGKVAVAAGAKATLSLDAAQMVTVGVSAVPADVTADPSAVNDLARQAVNNSHLVPAGSVKIVGDKVVLGGAEGVAINQGTISADGGGAVTVDSAQLTMAAPGSRITARGDAPGATGGTVQVLSHGRVGLFGDAAVDASGAAGGGTVLIGGPAQGKGCVTRAQATFVCQAATVRADATAQGDGGHVVVWGDEQAAVAGKLSARGGCLGGNGGLVETSGGKVKLSRTPDVSAPHGHGGTWLIDPNNITIVAGSCTVNITSSNPFCTTSCSASIGAGTLVSALAACGTDVLVTTRRSPEAARPAARWSCARRAPSPCTSRSRTPGAR